MRRNRSSQDLIFEGIRTIVDDRKVAGQLVTTRAQVVDCLMQLPDSAAIARDRSTSTLDPEGWLGNSFDWFTAKWGKTRHHAGLSRRKIDGYWAIDVSEQGQDRCGSVANA